MNPPLNLEIERYLAACSRKAACRCRTRINPNVG